MWLGIWFCFYLHPLERHQFLRNLFVLFCSSLPPLSAISIVFASTLSPFTLPPPLSALFYLKFQAFSLALVCRERITRPFAPIPTSVLACHLSSSFPYYLLCHSSLLYQLPCSQRYAQLNCSYSCIFVRSHSTSINCCHILTERRLWNANLLRSGINIDLRGFTFNLLAVTYFMLDFHLDRSKLP